MIAALVRRRRQRAFSRYAYREVLAKAMRSTPVAEVADREAARARRRYERWFWLEGYLPVAWIGPGLVLGVVLSVALVILIATGVLR